MVCEGRRLGRTEIARMLSLRILQVGISKGGFVPTLLTMLPEPESFLISASGRMFVSV